jgi:hypothetical protein
MHAHRRILPPPSWYSRRLLNTRAFIRKVNRRRAWIEFLLPTHKLRIAIWLTVAMLWILVIYPMVNVNEASAWCEIPWTNVERVSQVHANSDFVSCNEAFFLGKCLAGCADSSTFSVGSIKLKVRRRSWDRSWSRCNYSMSWSMYNYNRT